MTSGSFQATHSHWPHALAVLRSLMVRELRVRYKQSFLGVGWAILVPLALLITLSMVFTRWTGMSSGFETGLPYPLFLSLGLIPWMWFAQSLTQATNSLVANRNLVTKIYFPRQVFPLSSMGCSLFDMILASLVVIGMIIFCSASPGPTGWSFQVSARLWWIPAGLFVQAMLTTGLCLWCSAANLFYRDVKHILPVALQLGMFATNVLYPLDVTGRWGAVLNVMNPLIPIFSAYRWALTPNPPADALGFVLAASVSLILLVTGWFAFQKLEPKFAECI